MGEGEYGVDVRKWKWIPMASSPGTATTTATPRRRGFFFWYEAGGEGKLEFHIPISNVLSELSQKETSTSSFSKLF